MLIYSKKNINLKRISEFDKHMITAAETNNTTFEFEGKDYSIYSDGVFVQTLIDNRFLYRIFIDKDKNKGYVNNTLLKFF